MENSHDNRSLPPGWHYDEDTGAIMRDVIHRMGRRCLRWDYCGKGAYLITLTLKDRSQPLLGRLAGNSAASARIELSGLGRSVDAHLRRIGEFSPEIELLGSQIMPEHLHAVLRVRRRMAKPLGIALRGFKGAASQLYWRLAPGETRRLHGERTEPCERTEAGERTEPCERTEAGERTGVGERTEAGGGAGNLASEPGRAGGGTAGGSSYRGGCARGANRESLFADGYVDNILCDARAVEDALRYVADNPRRLWEKRAHPGLFKVLRDLAIPLAADPDGKPGVVHFAAIGNHALLDEPNIFQVQCSRSFFRYRSAANGTLLKDAPPAVAAREFFEKRDGFIEAAAHGAVLISPCISQGEREIARIAFAKGLKVITLSNKGFNPLYKPGGRLFDQCAGGNLLMLAPAAWPYMPGEKKMTRIDACILNRIAQWLAGPGAVEIRYRGTEPAQIDELARKALNMQSG